MRQTIMITEARLKEHQHPIYPKDIYCRECGESVREAVETTIYACADCQAGLNGTEKFCYRCGKDATTSDPESKYVFLGVPLTKTEYEQTRSAMAGKEYVLKKEGMSWRIDFVK